MDDTLFRFMCVPISPNLLGQWSNFWVIVVVVTVVVVDIEVTD